jgi:hypothetical protein
MPDVTLGTQADSDSRAEKTMQCLSASSLGLGGTRFGRHE